MRSGGGMPGVKAVRAKGNTYYYWTKVQPWVRLPDKRDAAGFMRKLMELERVAEKLQETRAGTLADAIRLYRKSPAFTDRKPNTRDLYATYLDQANDALPGASLAEITPQTIQRYIMDENADRRGAANMMLKVLHIVFKWSQARRAGLTDPTVGIVQYVVGEHEAWPDHVLAAALASEDDLFRRAVRLYLYTGQRSGDVCRMTWNVVTADNRIPVKQEKTDIPLLIPIHPRLLDEMTSAPRTTLTILANKMGEPLKPQTFAEWVKVFGRAHGVKKMVPHGLRKNAVNELLECECSTAQVSSITGQSLAMVEYYARQRNQGRIADVAMLKWGNHKKSGK